MAEWRDVVGYEGLYQVSDEGQVRSFDRVVQQPNGGIRTVCGRIMRQSPNPKGYPHVGLSLDGHSTKRAAHRIVLEAFVGLRPDGMECLHGDGDKTHNTLNNLRWGTNVENAADKMRHGTQVRGEKCARAKLTEGCIDRIIDMNTRGHTTREIGAWFGVTGATVSKILLGQRWAHLQRRVA